MTLRMLLTYSNEFEMTVDDYEDTGSVTGGMQCPPVGMW